MCNPKLLREMMGISAREFADILQCTYGQLSMMELGKRPLPATSILMCKAIDEWFAQASINTNNTYWGPPMDRYVRSRKILLDKVTLKAADMQRALTKAKRLQAFSQGFVPSSANGADEVAHLQLAILQRKSAKKVQQLGSKLLHLQLTIAALSAELEQAANLKKLLINV